MSIFIESIIFVFMTFDSILGQEHIKKYLVKTADEVRIPHAQLFVGKEGTGTLPMAIAYAQYILSRAYKLNTDKNSVTISKQDTFNHPDLHYVYPVAINDSVKKHPVSSHFSKEWQNFIKTNCYASYFDWLQHLNIEKKQAVINVDEAAEINKTLSLKSYEGGYKVLIIWMAEKMNTAASNKLLKLIEEPPPKTLLLLLTESKDSILSTILSRCQIIEFGKLNESVISAALHQNKGVTKEISISIAKQCEGNYNKALQLLESSDEQLPFEEWFIEWVRLAFKAKGNATVVIHLINWSSKIASLSRESQKQFINYCSTIFRQALLLNYNAKDLVYFKSKDVSFNLEKFAPFVNGSNINAIFEELNLALHHIDRNGNSAMIFNDLSLKLTRLIHKK